MWQLLKKYKRLSWFLGIPSASIGVLFLTRFLGGSTPEINPPGSPNPTNAIELPGARKISLEQLEEEMEKLKNKVFTPSPQKPLPVPLKFPNRDSMYDETMKEVQNKPSTRVVTASSELSHEERPAGRGLFPSYTAIHETASHAGEQSFYTPTASEIDRKALSPAEEGESRPRKVIPSFNSYHRVEVSNGGSGGLKKKLLLQTQILGNQTVVHGAEISLRTTQEFTLNHETLPRNTLVSAEVSLESDRFVFRIRSIMLDGNRYEAHFISVGSDQSSGVAVPAPRGARENGTGRDLLNETTDQLAYQVPVGGSLLSKVARRVFHPAAATSMKLEDGFEVNFTPTE